MISVVLVAFGIFLITLGILNIFNIAFYSKPEENLADNSDISNDPGEINNEEGSIGTGISTTLPEEVKKAEETKSQVESSAKLAREQSRAKSEKTGKWVATDYIKGDIGSGTYEVVKGDTLWEISEAVYGNGANWRQILAANSAVVGFLPDGSQALIIPGQVLVIP